MKARLRSWRLRWRRMPGRVKLGGVVAVIAMAGLVWQHYTYEKADAPPAQETATAADDHAGHDHSGDGHAYGEYQPDPAAMTPALDLSPDAARVVVERFAANFASPNGDFTSWLSRISPDITPALQDQYRLTDIRNVPSTSVTSVTGPLTADTLAPTYRVDYADSTAVEITTEIGVGGWMVSVVVPVQESPVQPSPELTDPGAGPPAIPAAPTEGP